MSYSLPQPARILLLFSLLAALLAPGTPVNADEVIHVTNLNDSGPGSLRQAILDANADPDHNEVVFDVTGTITLTTGELLVNQNLTISGPGVCVLTVSGDCTSRVFRMGDSTAVHVSLSGLLVQSGNAASANGGGVHNAADLTMTDCMVKICQADGMGGGIYNTGDLDMTRCIVSGSAKTDGGGVYNTNVLTMTDCEVTESSADDMGGGLYGTAGCTIAMTGCTVCENWAVSGGGGICSVGALTMANCTVSSNRAKESDGGGLFCITSTSPTSYVRMTFCTVTENLAADQGAGVYVQTDGVCETKNTIVAGNMTLSGQYCDWHGPIVSHGCNLFGSGNLGSITKSESTQPEDRFSSEPFLFPLATTGFTRTHPPLRDSPALDAVVEGHCSTIDGEPVTVDQRGASRPQDGDCHGDTLCDIGACEGLQLCSTLSIKVVNDGNVPLRSAPLAGDIDLKAGKVAPELYSYPGQYALEDDSLGNAVLSPGDSAVVTLRLCPNDPLYVWGSDVLSNSLVLSLGGECGQPRKPRPLNPASLSTSYMTLGAYQVLPGQAVKVSLNVCNSGELKGSQAVVLSVNGVAEQSQAVAVSGGSCKTVVFTVAKSVPGTYDIDVNGMHGQFTVLAPRIVQASVPSQQDTSLGTAGIIAIVVVMIVLIIGLAAVFRRS
ncbi:MAG: right-handed parallel beta-helix repeat-containing protein [Chloroflexi bacterium]|nr:right-handed parallel beta-helix repeat-containing protein [Chloroflexota bacterium]